jgi:6-phosphofructokinase 1
LIFIFQQGGSPSPFDRNLATDLAGTAFRWLAEKAEDNLTEDGSVVTGDKDSAVLLGLRKRVKQFTPVQVSMFSEYFRRKDFRQL